MKRINIFAKGNVDVHDSLHSCRLGGVVEWNGVNQALKSKDIAAKIRLVHEPATRSDALLRADRPPKAVFDGRDMPLGIYPLEAQFSDRLYGGGFDALILTIQPDIAAGMTRHRASGTLFYPNYADRWSDGDRLWLKSEFERLAPLSPDESKENFRGIVGRIRLKSDAPILIYNVSSVIPGEDIHCHQGLGEIYSTKVRRFNLALIELSEELGLSIIDVDTIIARAGADRLKLDAVHFRPEGYKLVAEEVVRVMQDLGLFAEDGSW